MKTNKPFLFLLAALTVPGIAPAADWRVEAPPLDPVFDHTITLAAGIGHAWESTRVRLDASDGTPGTPLDAERDLGFADNESTGRFELILRPRPRHRIRAGFNYLSIARKASTVLDQDVRFGDQVYLTGETVESQLRLRSWWISYGFSFLRLPNAEAGFSVGVSSLDQYGKAGVPARRVSETEERVVPAPQFGLDATIRFSPRWYGEARYQYVALSEGQREGSLSQLDAAAIFQFDPNIAVGLGYTMYRIRADVRVTGDSGLFNYSAQAPQLFLRASF
jgi:hypothetical protein